MATRLLIEADPALSVQTGNFGVRIDDARIAVPVAVAQFLTAHNLRSPEAFLTYARAFPNAVASEFHWSVDEAARAANALVSHLAGLIDEGILNPTPSPKRAFG